MDKIKRSAPLIKQKNRHPFRQILLLVLFCAAMLAVGFWSAWFILGMI